MPRRRGLSPRLLAAVVRSKATLAFAAERQVVELSALARAALGFSHEARCDIFQVSCREQRNA
jgi:hypothetical protein